MTRRRAARHAIRRRSPPLAAHRWARTASQRDSPPAACRRTSCRRAACHKARPGPAFGKQKAPTGLPDRGRSSSGDPLAARRFRHRRQPCQRQTLSATPKPSQPPAASRQLAADLSAASPAATLSTASSTSVLPAVSSTLGQPPPCRQLRQRMTYRQPSAAVIRSRPSVPPGRACCSRWFPWRCSSSCAPSRQRRSCRKAPAAARVPSPCC